MNNHYIPRFYQKNFSNKLYLYNLNNGQTIKKDIKNIFCEESFYSNELEAKLNKYIEEPFCKLLNEKLLKETTFCLSKDEEVLIRKYIQIQCMRMNFDKHIESNILDEKYTLENLFEDINNLIDNTYDDILNNQDKFSKSLVYYSLNINTNYMNFIESKDVSFVINDIGYITEKDIDARKSRLQTLASDFRATLDNIAFPDNFMFFPLSKNKGILFISNFFKMFDNTCREFKPFLTLDLFTIIDDKKFFKYHKYDKNLNQNKYSYTIIDELNIEYLNALLINETINFVAFEDLSKMKKSLKIYKHLNGNIGQFEKLEKYLEKKA